MGRVVVVLFKLLARVVNVVDRDIQTECTADVGDTLGKGVDAESLCELVEDAQFAFGRRSFRRERDALQRIA